MRTPARSAPGTARRAWPPSQFAVNQLRTVGQTNIAAELHRTARRPYERPLAVLGLN
ncbi:hypothetical protein AB0I51_46615 [Streptomyces sp. NPDC050549]|uniref:hypothetical protein n=1 Tax=Streptomyces sp. NPDC050549 TaxID=3155406 RepID=UPI003442B4ED